MYCDAVTLGERHIRTVVQVSVSRRRSLPLSLGWGLTTSIFRFWDIPSPWWQASTVLVGVGSALSLLVAITATAACCITYVVHTGTARIAGTLQFIAAVLVCSGAAVYPVGWDNREVLESCGNVSSVYNLGTCELSWSVYLLGSAVGLLLLCFGLSFCASRVKPGSFRI